MTDTCPKCGAPTASVGFLNAYETERCLRRQLAQEKEYADKWGRELRESVKLLDRYKDDLDDEKARFEETADHVQEILKEKIVLYDRVQELEAVVAKGSDCDGCTVKPDAHNQPCEYCRRSIKRDFYQAAQAAQEQGDTK